MSDHPRIHDFFVYLCVDDAPGAIDFSSRVFGAEEALRLQEPGGRVGHAELRIGPAMVLLADEHPELGRAPIPPPAGRRAVKGGAAQGRLCSASRKSSISSTDAPTMVR